ncbi:FG-GAP repeat protein, partial [Streptomyces sp. NPDC052415]|uniref:FG-GAP repeat protein n=1 Tax=Streptomyces sp. NPDC052415 TaxID=3365690 RepID=UPI0037D2C197
MPGVDVPVRRSPAIALALLGAIVAATPLAQAAPETVTQDFNGDGYEDLVTGVPSGQVAGKKRAGYVAVVYGSARSFLMALGGLVGSHGWPGRTPVWCGDTNSRT